MNINYNSNTPSPTRSQRASYPPPVVRAALPASSFINTTGGPPLPNLGSYPALESTDMPLNLRPRAGSHLTQGGDQASSLAVARMPSAESGRETMGSLADLNPSLGLPELSDSPPREQLQPRNSGHTISYAVPPPSPAQSDSSVEI